MACPPVRGLTWSGGSSRLIAGPPPRLLAHASAGQDDHSPYIGSDGRRKATLQEANWRERLLGADGLAPWQMGFQVREQNLLWNDSLKARLWKVAAARELGIDEAQLERNLEEVARLLPGASPQLRAFRPQTLALLVADPKRLADTLLCLKRVFPRADALRLLAGQPTLVLKDTSAIEDTAAALRELLPRLDVDKLVVDCPPALDFDSFSGLVSDFQRLFPGMDVQATLQTNPAIVFGLQKGKDLIPYDEPYPG